VESFAKQLCILFKHLRLFPYFRTGHTSFFLMFVDWESLVFFISYTQDSGRTDRGQFLFIADYLEDPAVTEIG